MPQLFTHTSEHLKYTVKLLGKTIHTQLPAMIALEKHNKNWDTIPQLFTHTSGHLKYTVQLLGKTIQTLLSAIMTLGIYKTH